VRKVRRKAISRKEKIKLKAKGAIINKAESKNNKKIRTNRIKVK